MESESTDGKIRGFRHPFLQACGMFLGEMLCMVAFYLVKCYREKKRQRELVRNYVNSYLSRWAQEILPPKRDK